MHSTKIAIIGAGAVGATIAYTLICKDVPADIALIDIDEKRCKGELLDLQDALSFCKLTHIKAGQTTDAQDADIIVITAGARQKIDQPRIELLQENKKIITSLLTKIMPIKKDAILIMVHQSGGYSHSACFKTHQAPCNPCLWLWHNIG